MQLMEYILQLTADLKTPLQILFLKRSERKECSKISKIPEKYLQNSSEILTSGKKDPKKNFSFQCSEIVGILP